jgi:hypothetical protein
MQESNLPIVLFPKQATPLESDPLIALQLLELKPLGHAVYLFFSIKISERNSLVSPSQLGLEPSAGFKPAPFLLEARHSVHLSYEGIWSTWRDSNPHCQRSKRCAFPLGYRCKIVVCLGLSDFGRNFFTTLFSFASYSTAIHWQLSGIYQEKVEVFYGTGFERIESSSNSAGVF